MSSNTIIPTAQLTTLKQDLDGILAPIKAALQAKVYAENLPIIGTLIGSAATQGQAALQRFATLETNVFNALTALNNAPQTVAQVQTAIGNALTNAGFAANGAMVDRDPVSGQLTVTLNDSATDTFSTALGSNFGLPGLDFQTHGTAQTTLGYSLDVTASVDSSGTFSDSTPGGAPALTVNLDVRAPSFNATGTLGTANDTLLGELRFGAVDNGTTLQGGTVVNGSTLHGSFSLDTSGNASFTGNANLNVELTSDMGTAALPSISADLVGGWTFSNSTVDPANAASFGDTPTIALDNVTYKLGTFVDNFIDPVIDDVNSILQSAPVQTALAIFDTPLDFLGGGLASDPNAKGDNGLLGPLWKDLDVGGAIDPNTGLDVGDGQITLVDFLQLAQNLGAGIDVAPLVQFLSAVHEVQQWVTALAGSGTTFGSTTYSLGSFSIPDDVRNAAQLISQVVPVQDPGAPAQDLNTLLDSLAGGSGPSDASTAPTAGQALKSLLTGPIFSFPIISNPAEAVQFLLGGTVDLFDATLPQASIGLGAINSAGVPTSTFPLLDLPIPTPILGLILDLTLGAAFQGSVGLDFGYDTTGLTAYKNSGFTAPGDILNGLFVEAPKVNGVVEPVVQLAGAVEFGATLAAGPLASISASGDVGGVLDLTFSQAGKNYLTTLAQEVQTNGPFSIFNASGRVTAGFEAVAKAIFLSPWTFNSPRVTLAQFGTGLSGSGTNSSGPTIPTNTTWIGGASGDFETAAKWSPTFAPINGAGSTTDYYGDATIGAGSTVTFQGPAPADLTSLTLAAGSTLNLTQGTLTIEDSTIDSPNSGTIVVGGSAQLIVEAGFDNTGLIALTGGTLVASGLLSLHGKGRLLLPNAPGSFIQSTDPNSLLWNVDNTISGGGTIGAGLLNQGVVNANVSNRLMLAAADINEGLLEATGNGGGSGTPHTGGLEIAGPLDNSGGTLAATNNGLVLLDNGVTVSGGTLTTAALADGSVIRTEGSVTLNGGTLGLTVAGIVLADSASTLTLTGLTTSDQFSATSGNSRVASGNGTVLLQGATIHNGLLDAQQLTSGPHGTMAVSGTATLDGSAGDGSIGIDGTLQVAAGNTLVVDGSVNPGGEGGGINLAGTLVIGDAISDAVTLGASLPGSVAGTGGNLTLEDNSVVTGADAGSSLTNEWDISGAGTLGNGQLAIINTSSGTIAAAGTLVINGGVPVINAGVISADSGVLYLESDIANAGGTIQVGLFTGAFLDGVTVGGGELAGVGPGFGFAGTFIALGHATLDGSASPVTLTDVAEVVVQSGNTLTLVGSIVNISDSDLLIGQSTIAVLGNPNLGDPAILQISGTVTLSGGGVVVLADTTGTGSSDTQVITGTSGDTLDNVDNQIVGYGSIGVGDNTLTLINEAAGTIDASSGGGALVVNTGTHTLVNHGLLEATSGGTLDLQGSIANAGAILLATDGTVLLDNARLSGGSIESSGTGSVRVVGASTLDGTVNAITVAAGADVAVDAGDTLTAIGTIINDGTMQATGGTLVMATGAIAVTNLGQLRADLGGLLDLRSNVANAGGTIAVTAGAVALDGMTVTNGLLTGDTSGAGFIHVVNHATLIGTGTVAAGANASPTTGLLNTGDIRVESGNTLALKGIITNRGFIEVIGDATATLQVSGTVVLAGGGMLEMSDTSGAESPIDQLITGTAATDTLNNVDNTISGYGQIGAGDGLLNFINAAAGTVDAATSTLIVNTGAHPVINQGLLESTTGVLDLHGTITNTGGTIAAVGGTTELDGVTISGGTLATTGGVIASDGSATLNGSTAVVTLAPAAQVIVGGGNLLTLEGTIVNQATLGVSGDSYNSLVATLQVAGTVALSGSGEVSLYSVGGGPASAFQVITGTTGAATLDNIGNTIVGYGEIGDGLLTLRNEAAGVIDATGGALVVNTGTNIVVNHGSLEAVGGTLVLQSVVDGTTGGTLLALDLGLGAGLGGTPGVIQLDGGTLRGGTVNTDLSDSASMLTVSANGGTLDGTGGGIGGAVTLAAGAQAVVGAGTVLTAKGTIANHGTLSVAGDSYNNIVATLQVAGTVSLSGGGELSLYALNAGPSSQDQLITGASTADKLDNIDNTIVGYGTLGGGQMTLANEAAGIIEAVGGALVINTGTAAVSNLGLMQAVGGTLVIQGVVDGTKGGTVATLDDNGVSGIVQLDGGTLRGGTLRTNTADPSSQLQVTANGGTLDGTSGALILAAGAVVDVIPGGTLTVEGTITNHGTVAVGGNGYYGIPAELLLSGTVALSGGGLLSLVDASGLTNATTSQVVIGAVAATTLDNIDNLISGYGELGAGQLTLINETKGVVEAIGGTLQIDTGTQTVSNKGLLEAVGGTLLLRGVVDNTAGGTIAALHNAGAGSGVVLMDGATLHGGTIRTDLQDPGSMLGLTANGGTLDGIAGSVTLAAGAQVEIAGLQTLTLEGTIVGPGTISVLGNGYYGYPATAQVAGNVTLTGGGKLLLADVSGLTAATSSQVVTGTAASDTLDNLTDTIIGYGSLGAGNMTLVNAAGGTVEATGGTLQIDTGANAVTNKGLLEAIAGTLELDSAITNSGTIAAGTGGDVVINATIGNTGLVIAGDAGTITLHGAVTGASSTVQVAAGGMLVVDGGSLRSGTLGNAAAGIVDITTNGGTLAGVTVTNAGTAEIVGNGYYGLNATLAIAGTTTLTGGGTLVLTDGSGLTAASTSQVITGVAPGDTLDNINNTIIGYGELGAGQLTLINAAAGTIEAAGATMVLDSGAVALVNHGRLEAVGGTLIVQTVVDDTGGGTVAALNSGVGSGIAAPGIVELDGGTLRGGTVMTDPTDPASGLILTTNGGTLDGTAGAVTLTAASQVTVAALQTLALEGTIGEHGTLAVLGNGYYGEIAEVQIAGTLTLSGGGLLALADVSGLTAVSTSQVVTGATPGAKLDNSAQISGFGMLGNGSLTLVNEAIGTIEAIGGTLVIDAGTGTATNSGQMRAVGGTLQLENTLTNAATIAAGAGGAIVIDGTVNTTGLISAAATSTITLHGSVVGAGTLQVGNGASLVVDGGSLRGGTLSNAASGIVDITTNGGTLAGVTVNNAGTIEVVGNGYYGLNATLAIAGTTTLTGGGTLVLTDGSGLTAASTSQVITGVAPGDTLDNINNTIIGYGELGAGQLTLINAAAGTIEAAGGTMVLDTGAVALVNHGRLDAVGGTLIVQSVVDDTSGGTVAALSNGIAPGIIELDGGTLRGGTVTTDPANQASGLVVTSNGGTLDGSAGTLTLTAASHVTVAALQTLTVKGTIVEHGTLAVQGNGYYGETAELQVGGTVTLSGGGVLAITDGSGLTAVSTSQVITGATATAKLDNIDNTIIGYGELGAGQLALINAASGTIDASGGTLVVDAGAGGSLSNAGLMQALSGALDVVSSFTNSGVVVADGGVVVLEGNVTGTGELELDDANLTLDGSVASGQSVVFGNFGTTETLDIANPKLMRGTIGGFASGDGIIVENSTLTAANYVATTGTLGTLALIAGTTAVGTLTLAGHYVPADFQVTANPDGTSLVSLIPGVGAVLNHATASAAAPNPVDFGQHHVGDLLSQTLSIGNIATIGASTEALDANIGGTSGDATASGSFTLLPAGGIDTSHLKIGLATSQDGAQSGSVILALNSDGTGIDTFGVTPLASQTITVDGTLYNYATATTVAPVSFGERHVGDTLSQALTITNSGTIDGFTETLDASVGGTAGAATASGSFNRLGVAVTDSTSLKVGLTSAVDGVQTGTVALNLTSDGAGIDSLGTTALASQTITATGTLFNYATASVTTPVSLGKHHVGDTAAQSLTIINVGVADGFTEALDGSIGGTTGAATATGSFGGLGPSHSDGTSVTIGLLSTQDGAHSGTAKLSLTSDGSGVDSLGSSPLTAQTITATGSFYNFATASAVAPNPVNFGTHHVGDTLAQSLSIINSGTADGFTENLDGSIGGTTGAATASGSFNGLGASKSDSASLTIGLLSTQDGAHAGTATLTLNSDGGTIDGLGTTALAAQTIAATGTFYNYATASAVSGNFGNHHVGDVLSEVLSITNAGTADGFTEALGATIGGATGGATASGSFSGLAASKTDTSHLTIGLSSAGDGLHSGTAVLTAISDGTGIDSLGTTALTAQTIAVTGTLYNYATASVLAPSTVNFGVHHVGDSLQQGIAIGNLGTFDGFTEALDVGFGGTIGAAYGGIGSAVTNTPFTLTAESYRAIAIGLATTHDGVQSGAVTVTAASDGTGIDNLGTTPLASQTIAATGTLYNFATASTAGTVDLGNHHVGDTISQALTITNAGTADGFTENLDASIGNATGAITVKGSFSGLAASKSNASSLTATLAAASEGRQSGTAVVTFASDGSGIDGLGNKTLQAQTITAAGTIFGYATPILSATTLDFAASRLGGVVPTRSLTISDGSTANPFQENLGYAFHAPSGGFGLTSSAVGTVVAGAAAATVSWSVLTSVSGVLATSTDLVDFTSLGAGTSGLANTALTSQRIALLAKVYAPAVAQLGASSVNFGVVHVGDVITGGDTITNTVTGGLTDVLTGGIGTIIGSAFSGTTTLGTGLVAGASKRLSFGLNTGVAGVFGGSAALVLASHDADQADLTVTAAPITLSGTVDNYATATIEELSGGGSFSHSGSLYTLNLGTVGIGAASPTAALGVLNAANGLADLLSGSFAVGGSGFINNGLTAFSGVGAGNADTTPTIALSTTQIGTFTETVTLLANGSNSSGYLGALPAEILTITGTVIPGPRALVWTGAGSTDFADPFNWNDTTSALDPAISAPKVADTAMFSGDGGVITGTGTAASLSFGGGGAWHLGSGAALTTPGGVTVGTTEAAQLLINGAASLVGTGSAGASIAAQPGASGSSVNVTGAGSDWQIAGALDVGDAATGVLAITNGATVSAATLDAGGEASGAGVITVSGPGADLVTTGTVTIGDAGSGELSILNGANATIGGDLNVANAGSGTGNVDIEDTTGTITFGGNILVGFNGFGVFNVGYNVDYIQNNGGIIFGPNSSGAINSFADPSPFLSNSSPSPISIGAQGVDQLAAYLFNSGEFTIPTNHSLTFETPIISGGGSFALGSGDSLVLNADTVTGQTFTLGSNDKLTIGIDQLATIDLPASGTGPFTPEVNPNKGDLLLGNFGGVIANFTSGDTIDVDTYLSSAAAGTLSQNGSVVSVIEIANGATLGVLRFDTAANAAAAVTDGAIALVPCFAAGTRIATARGEVAVEAIGVGDRVQVLLGDGFAEVIWAGRREVDCADHPTPRKVWPVRVAAGAFGPGRPHSDLFVSPDHAVFVNEVLIPIRHLINGSTIAQVTVDRVTYHHIELAEHDVLLAEGLPAESFLDMRDGSKYANRPGPVRLYPDYSARMWEAFGCARLVVAGPELAKARALVAGFAAVQQAA